MNLAQIKISHKVMLVIGLMSILAVLIAGGGANPFGGDFAGNGLELDYGCDTGSVSAIVR